jgi:hypothetical protein
VLPIKTGPPSAADLLKPPEPGPWRLQMTADMVHNGFPLVDALGLKSYLGNLYVGVQGRMHASSCTYLLRPTRWCSICAHAVASHGLSQAHEEQGSDGQHLA